MIENKNYFDGARADLRIKSLGLDRIEAFITENGIEMPSFVCNSYSYIEYRSYDACMKLQVYFNSSGKDLKFSKVIFVVTNAMLNRNSFIPILDVRLINLAEKFKTFLGDQI